MTRAFPFAAIWIAWAWIGLPALAATPAESSLETSVSLPQSVLTAVAKASELTAVSCQETCKQRNVELNHAFREYTQDLTGEVLGRAIRDFNSLVKRSGMTCFDDFYDAMLVPQRFVTDPISGSRVPVVGPLGSDIINPWLAAMGVAEGRPLEEQPMYQLASDVLREQIDFAIIGMRDPSLSLNLLPAELHANARWAYQRLNPNNRFDGGFDQPLFYITIREAAKKLFRVDHPAAKMTMAEIVLPEDKGGLGIRSCLLCHERDHTDVYGRLLGQSLFYQNKSADQQAAAGDTASEITAQSEELQDALEMATMFQLAADRVLEYHGDKIDVAAAQEALSARSANSLTRLLPGFDQFYETFDSIGCTTCHSSLEEPSPEHDPAKFGAFVLTPNNYFKSKNIQAVAELIDMDDVANSRLLAKAGGKTRHRGAQELQLSDDELQQLESALIQWLHSIELE